MHPSHHASLRPRGGSASSCSVTETPSEAAERRQQTVAGRQRKDTCFVGAATREARTEVETARGVASGVVHALWDFDGTVDDRRGTSRQVSPGEGSEGDRDAEAAR
jgi:hypothetical protein